MSVSNLFKFFFSTFFLFVWCPIYSQSSEADSLKSTINSINDPTLKSEFLVDLIRNYIDPKNDLDYPVWVQKLCSLNVSNNIRFECEQAKLKILYTEEKYDDHLYMAKQLLKNEYIQQDKAKRYSINNFIIDNFYYKREEDSILKYLFQSQKFTSKPSEEVYIYDKLAEMYYIKGDFTTATHYVDSVLSIANKFDNSNYKAEGLYRLAKIQRKTKFYDEALVNYQSSLDILLKKDSITRSIGATYLEMAVLSKQMKNFDNALNYLTKAFYIYKKLDRQRTLATIHDEFSVCYIRLKDYETSFFHVNQAIKIKNEINIKSDLKYSYSRLGRLYYLKKEKDFDKAIHYLNLSKELYELKGSVEQKMYLELYFFNAYQLQKNTNQATKHFNQFIKLKDSLNKSINRKAIAESEVKYKTLEKEKEIQSNKLLIATKQRNFLISVSIGSFILLLLGLMYFKKRKKENQLQNIIEHVKQLSNKILYQEEEAIKRKNNLDSTTFSKHLTKEYNLTKATYEYWDRQAFGITEKEMETLFDISKSSVQSRRKELYKRLSAKTSTEEYDRHSSVSLYLEEIVDFMNAKIQSLQSDSEE
ncbi:tetratricopeptide repeat protein [Dokdonia ponticola]|uniref:Tetratricopeptide repeat protein n=1 Tax=Dokdonia ponticola TaxID=2041041 RepID=A0ABV9I1A8_9FLAO